MAPKTGPRADSWLDPVLGATPAFVLPSFCPALQGIALCIRSGCALAKNRFACNEACRQRMSVWVTLTPASRVAHFGNAFMLLLVGTGSLKFWHNLCRSWCNFRRTFFIFFVGKNTRFVGLVSGTNSGPVLDPGVQNEGRFRDQNMDPENSWFSCAIADHIM